MKDNRHQIIFTVLALAAAALLATDMIVPSLPDIARDLHTSATFSKLTISIYMLGLAISPLFFGPASDRFGRRPILILAAILGFFGMVMAIFANNITELLLARFFQATALGACLAMVRVMSRDLFHGQALTRVASWISLTIALGPAIAPIIGNEILLHFGWRIIFAVLAGYIAITGFLVFNLVHETSTNKNRHATKIKTMIKNYRFLLCNAEYMTHMSCTAAAMAGIITFFSLVPFIFSHELHLDHSHFGWVIASISGMTILSRGINVILARHFHAQVGQFAGLSFMMVGALFLLTVALLKVDTLSSLMIPMMLYIIGTGLVFPNSFSQAITPFKDIAGSAGALYASFQMGMSFVAGAIASVLASNELTLAVLLTAISAFPLLIFWFNSHKFNDGKLISVRPI